MFRRRRSQDDFNAEVEAHLQLETEQLKEQGLSGADARRAALRAFGNVTLAQERFYESGRWLGCTSFMTFASACGSCARIPALPQWQFSPLLSALG